MVCVVAFLFQPIPILRRGNSGSVTISQHQAASLLAHAFFCTFPSRNIVSNELPSVNFCRLFSLHSANAVEKLRCLMHYFHIISKKSNYYFPTFHKYTFCLKLKKIITVVHKCGEVNCALFTVPIGLLTIRRQNDSAQDWSSIHLPLSKLYVNHTGTIEDDGYGMLQVDFANEYIGGGVLSGGCVQVSCGTAIQCQNCNYFVYSKISWLEISFCRKKSDFLSVRK